jgi:hypothetical protein
MDQNISDCKFWVMNYADSFKAHEKLMTKIEGDVSLKVKTAMHEMNKKISINDIKLNFRALNDLMFVKF